MSDPHLPRHRRPQRISGCHNGFIHSLTCNHKQNNRDEFLAFHCPGSKWGKCFAIHGCLIVKDAWTDRRGK